MANLYLIAHEEHNEVSTSNLSQFILYELQDVFDELFFEFKKMGTKNNFLKKIISIISKENENLQKKNKVLKNEVCVLKEKVKENSFLK